MTPTGPRTTFLGKVVILAFIAACGWEAYRLFLMRGGKPLLPEAPKTTIRIATSSGKIGWLTWAASAFAKNNAGRNVDIELLPVDARDANVWAPASSLEKDAYGVAFLNEKSIALTPMAFVMWGNRLPAFQARYGPPSLASFAKALAEPRGWEGGGHPEWGLFKFGIEDRDAALALLAYDELQKINGLTPHDALEAGTSPSLHSLAHNATVPMSMRDFATRGTDAFDAALVYEASALEHLDAAQKKWGELRIVYPDRNLWADNPYYILDVPWSTPDQRNAAQAFLDFLMSEPAQQQAVAHGFRPADPHVPTNADGSPFVVWQRNGARENAGQTCAPPPPAVLDNLLAAWQRAR